MIARVSAHPHTSPPAAARPVPAVPGRADLTVALGLVALVVAVYAQAGGFGFTLIDDDRYVTYNPHVLGGLTWAGVRWAFTSFDALNWHPLTWLSHMLDVTLFGLHAGAHHLVSVAFHAASAVLLHGFLVRTTGARWRSAFVAALFAVHPLHVESVAWIAERKDVLAGLFALATLHAYASYAARPGVARYLGVVLCLTLGLLAKPMLVSLPFALLLVDVWPLGRLDPRSASEWKARVAEKLPLLLLAVLASDLTWAAQSAGGAVRRVAESGLGGRVANAIVAYATYLVDMVWPARLAVFYPHPADLGRVTPPAAVAAALALLVAITAVAWRAARVRPAVPVGWLWYLGTLVPVIGLVQVGRQSHADRYTYLPLIGVFVMIAWAVPDAWPRTAARRAALGTVAACVVAALTVVAWRQAGTWRDDFALFGHARAVTRDNWLATNNLGVAYEHAGRCDVAAPLYAEAARIRPSYVDAWYNMGSCAAKSGRTADAIVAYQRAVLLSPRHARAWHGLGVAYARAGDTAAADRCLREARRLDAAAPDAPLHPPGGRVR